MAKKTTGSSAGIVVTPRAIVAVQASAHENEIEIKVRGAVETPPETLSGGARPAPLGHACATSGSESAWRTRRIGRCAGMSYGTALRYPTTAGATPWCAAGGAGAGDPPGEGAFDFLCLSGEPGVPQTMSRLSHQRDHHRRSAWVIPWGRAETGIRSSQVPLP